MTHALAILALALVQQSSGGPPTEAPCAPEGGTTGHDFDRPPLGQPGDPVGAEWVDRDPDQDDNSGDPQIRESDPVNDDAMGPATPSADGGTATAPVTNSGGDLSGPNGEDQNGGAEGPCIEVYVEWTYRYPVAIHRTRKLSFWGTEAGETEVVYVWRTAKKRSLVKEICPC